jgi:outer membrane protein
MLRYHGARPQGAFVPVCMCILACIATSFAAHGQNFSWRDPLGTGKLVAPEPSQPWNSKEQLPPVAGPDWARLIPPEARQPLSLAQLTDLALRLNLRTRQAWLQAQSEAATLGIESADEWPQLNAAFNYRIGRVVSGTTGLPATCPAAPSQPFALNCTVQALFGPSISLSYVLFDFGQRAADVEAAQFRLLAANLLQNRTLQEVVYQVEQAYYRVIAFDYLVNASRESLKNFETALDAAQRRRSSGLATAGDVYRAETQVGQAQLALSRNEGEQSKARGQLANIVGLPVNFPLQLQSMSDLPPVSEITLSIDALLDKAKASRPDLVAAEARARAARASERAASKAGLPSIELAANYTELNFGDARRAQDVYNFGFNIKIPLFSGFRDTYTVQRARVAAEQSESARDQLYSQTELDVWQAYFDLQTSASSVASTANLVKSANESAAAAAARYQAGMGSLLDLITAQLDNTNARVLRIQSFLDWYTALARLNFSLGSSDVLSGMRKAP